MLRKAQDIITLNSNVDIQEVTVDTAMELITISETQKAMVVGNTDVEEIALSTANRDSKTHNTITAPDQPLYLNRLQLPV